MCIVWRQDSKRRCQPSNQHMKLVLRLESFFLPALTINTMHNNEIWTETGQSVQFVAPAHRANLPAWSSVQHMTFLRAITEDTNRYCKANKQPATSRMMVRKCRLGTRYTSATRKVVIETKPSQQQIRAVYRLARGGLKCSLSDVQQNEQRMWTMSGLLLVCNRCRPSRCCSYYVFRSRNWRSLSRLRPCCCTDRKGTKHRRDSPTPARWSSRLQRVKPRNEQGCIAKPAKTRAGRCRAM